jgi:hypothetical protein
MDYVTRAKLAAQAGAGPRMPDPGPSDALAGRPGGTTKTTLTTKGGGPALLIFSRVLSEEVWLTEDEVHAEELERSLQAKGDMRLVFTAGEVAALAGMLTADLRTIANLKRWFPGSRIDAVTFTRAGGDEEIIQ